MANEAQGSDADVGANTGLKDPECNADIQRRVNAETWIR